MSPYSIQDILSSVEQPSRYLGTEINAVKKDLSQVKLRIALAFPDLYEIGTSHFGLSILYHILNQRKEIAAERVFAPGLDLETALRSNQRTLFSLESQLPLPEFDIIGFSLLYELNYTNILNILALSNIPFHAVQRDCSHPLIIAGGPCTCNPEPVADFFDAMVVGDGEDVVVEMSDVWLQWRRDGDGDRETLLKAWSKLEGVYIPAFFEPLTDVSGHQTVRPRFTDYSRITRAVTRNLDQAPFPNAPVVPFGKPIHDRLRLEVSRGCTRGCRFCQAGMIYRPVRERSARTLLDLARQSLAATGYEDISLLSLSTGDYECIDSLLACIMAQCENRHIAVSLPSLRAGTLSPGLMRLIKRVRKTGFTIAPEAGSQRLREVINKNITDEDIRDTVKNAFELGWQVIKLYFMIGLPTETDSDLQALVDMVKDLRNLRDSKQRRSKINVSLATFIPKPHTPFQWEAQNTLSESTEKLAWIKSRLNVPGVQVKWQDPQVSLIEGLWSRGDRRLSRLLVEAYASGCKFDGWSDNFRFKTWMAACRKVGIDIDQYTNRVRDVFEPLPWDHIDTKVEKGYLRQEWARARNRQLTGDCRHGDCNSCGVCDFDALAPQVCKVCDQLMLSSEKKRGRSGPQYIHYKVLYAKTGQARFFGHLEMVKIFLRAIRRAQIPVKHSEGFHPKPKVSFGDSLPVGMESLAEYMYIGVGADIDRQSIGDRINPHLPEGLEIRDCLPARPGWRKDIPASVTYAVALNAGQFDNEAVAHFLHQPEFFVSRFNRKGKQRSIDLRSEVMHLEVLSPTRLQMTLKNSQGPTVRPAEILKAVFHFSDSQIRYANIIKLEPANHRI